MNIESFVENATKWQSDTWHVYACYTHDGGSRLEVNGLGKWRVTRKGELILTSESAEVAGQAYCDLMPAYLQKDFD